MYSISQVAELTGVSAYTLRYYEKIGVLPSPERNSGGMRKFSERDLRFVRFLNSLKKTGMTLEDITEFVRDGCILEKIDAGQDVHNSIDKRMEILVKHLHAMEAQREELERVITVTKEKLAIYRDILEKREER
ncbi:MerR family transcriptional regulator [Paenibacillus aestuarii]|uniref:MerR family transcriptional regulator n=1 Tax=Paenibacillus aestuarii TaxID=516965 RepID=A0ABW0KDM8_9BACL|nr:MerR family transcriptional regulator [Paenibacillus aestuarii]